MKSKVRVGQRFGNYQVIDSELLYNPKTHKNYVLCYNELSNNIRYVYIYQLLNLDICRKSANKYRQKNKESLNKYARERYHRGKPDTLEKFKKYYNKYYWNNPTYRSNQIEKNRKYYNDNPDYFQEYRQSDKYKEACRKYRNSEHGKKVKKEWEEKNKDRLKEYRKNYQRTDAYKERQKKTRLDSINKRRVNKNLPPVDNVEIHFQQRKQESFKRIWFSHVYDSK